MRLPWLAQQALGVGKLAMQVGRPYASFLHGERLDEVACSLGHPAIQEGSLRTRKASLVSKLSTVRPERARARVRARCLVPALAHAHEARDRVRCLRHLLALRMLSRTSVQRLGGSPVGTESTVAFNELAVGGGGVERAGTTEQTARAGHVAAAHVRQRLRMQRRHIGRGERARKQQCEHQEGGAASAFGEAARRWAMAREGPEAAAGAASGMRASTAKAGNEGAARGAPPAVLVDRDGLRT
eukprot:scaffold98741_cov26-Tisochrysis_lutea.AAC.2